MTGQAVTGRRRGGSLGESRQPSARLPAGVGSLTALGRFKGAGAGRFKGARALRLLPGAPWDDVESCETVDAATGEILERRHAETNPARAHAAGRRLDKVSDIKTVVALLEVSTAQGAANDEAELVDLTLGDGGAESDRPVEFVDRYVAIEKGVRWADCGSNSD